MNPERYDEARILAQALEQGLREVRDDVTTLVAAEVQRTGLTGDETRHLIRGVLQEELDRQARSRTRAWIPGAIGGFVAGLAAAVATLVLSGATPF